MPVAGLSHIAFSFTNRCNLRCVYCPQGTHPDDFHAETPKEQIDRIIAYALENRVSRISIGYYDEAMLVEGWEKAVEPLFGRGFTLNLVSNFSKVMTPAEVAAVSRFQEVQISIDTIDIPLLKQVRKAVDARTVLYNTHLIRAHVLRHGLPMPKLIWTPRCSPTGLPRACPIWWRRRCPAGCRPSTASKSPISTVSGRTWSAT